jgi:hypothetical protein
MILNFTIKGQILSQDRAQQSLRLVADSKKYLVAKVAFESEEWKRGRLVYVLFTHKGKTYKRILGADKELGFDECYIPAEVIKAPGFTLSMVCDDRITTNEIAIKLEPSGYTEDIENQKATPSVMEQMNTLMYKYASLCNDILKECQKINEKKED